MLNVNGKTSFSAINFNGKQVDKVYFNTDLVWESTIYIAKPTMAAATFTYNGNEQGPTFTYDANGIASTSNTKGTNAGSYEATFTLKEGYAWTDGTRDTHKISWSIGKAAGNITLGATSGTASYPSTLTFTASSTTGSVSVSSGNTGICTVGISGTTVTVTPTTSINGTAVTITATAAASTNYNAASKTYSATFNKGTITVTATPGKTVYGTTATAYVKTNIAGCKVESGTSTSYGTTSSSSTTANTNVSIGTRASNSAGATTYYYRVSKAGYNNVTGSTTAAVNRVVLSATSGSASYPSNITFTVSTNTGGGTLSVATNSTTYCSAKISGTTVTCTPTTSINGTATTVTVTSAATGAYCAASATYTATFSKGTITLTLTKGSVASGSTATAYAKTNIAGCKIEHGSSTSYGTTATSSSTANTNVAVGTRTAAGSETRYVRASKAGYNNATGTIGLYVSYITLSATSGTMSGASSTFTASVNSGGTLTVKSSNTAVATVSISGSTVTCKRVKKGSATITVSAAATGNWVATSRTYALTVGDYYILSNGSGSWSWSGFSESNSQYFAGSNTAPQITYHRKSSGQGTSVYGLLNVDFNPYNHSNIVIKGQYSWQVSSASAEIDFVYSLVASTTTVPTSLVGMGFYDNPSEYPTWGYKTYHTASMSLGGSTDHVGSPSYKDFTITIPLTGVTSKNYRFCIMYQVYQPGRLHVKFLNIYLN